MPRSGAAAAILQLVGMAVSASRREHLFSNGCAKDHRVQLCLRGAVGVRHHCPRTVRIDLRIPRRQVRERNASPSLPSASDHAVFGMAIAASDPCPREYVLNEGGGVSPRSLCKGGHCVGDPCHDALVRPTSPAAQHLTLPRMQVGKAWRVINIAHVCNGSEVKTTVIGWSRRHAQARARRWLNRYQPRASR